MAEKREEIAETGCNSISCKFETFSADARNIPPSNRSFPGDSIGNSRQSSSSFAFLTLTNPVIFQEVPQIPTERNFKSS